jgi:hypothetical protein
MHPEGREVVDRRAFLKMVADAAAGAGVVAGMPEIAAAQTSKSQPRGGQLYMQTNEVRNAIVHYRWSKSGTLTEVERVPTGGAGSGTFKPISGQESAPNAFEGAGSVVLSPVSSPCDGRDEAKLQSAAAEIGGTSGKVRVLAGDISSPATGAALVESAERHFGGLDKFDSGTRWPSFTTQGGGR